MRRILISLLVALPLLGAGIAQADTSGGGTTTATGQAMVVGTIVSVDAGNNSFVANAFVVPPFGGGSGSGEKSGGFGGAPGGAGFFGGFGGSGGFGGFGGGFRTDLRARDLAGAQEPTATQVTITTDSNTKLELDGKSATISDLAAGQRFRAVFTGSPTDSISTLVANPAVSVSARSAPKRHALYAFVGAVTGTDTTAGTVSVTVTASYPSGLVAGGSSATFTVGSSTLVIGGSGTNGFFGGSLSNVSTGDIVAGGLIGATGLTAAQVESTPLMLLLDLPLASSGTTTSASVRQAKASALTRAERLLGVTATKQTHAKRHARKHAKKHNKRSAKRA